MAIDQCINRHPGPRTTPPPDYRIIEAANREQLTHQDLAEVTMWAAVWGVNGSSITLETVQLGRVFVEVRRITSLGRDFVIAGALLEGRVQRGAGGLLFRRMIVHPAAPWFVIPDRADLIFFPPSSRLGEQQRELIVRSHVPSTINSGSFR